MTWGRLVFLDGIWVPSAAVACEWSDKGTAGARITLVPSKEAKRILPSTHVQIYHVEAGLASKKKTVVDVPADAAIGDRSMFSEESSQTLGDTFFPQIDLSAKGFWFTGLPLHAMHLRFAGEVISVAETESAGQGASTQLVCRGYDHLMDIVQAIQLTRGRGTLSDEERRFFGQQNPVFVGSGRRAFFDGMAELLEDAEYGLAETCRRLASVYPARINTWAAHRFAWTRLADQMCSVDNDTTVERLLSTEAFSRYLRDTIQQKYSVTLRAAIASILSFPSYRMIAIPTPAYFPLYRPNTPVSETESVESEQETERSYRYATVTVPQSAPFPVVPAGEEGTIIGETGEYGETAWFLQREDGTTLELETQVYPGATLRGSLSDGNRTLTVRIPSGTNGGPQTGSQTYTVTILESLVNVLSAAPLSSSLRENLSEFRSGATYAIDWTESYPGVSLAPGLETEFVVEAEIKTRLRSVRRTVEEQETVTPPAVEDPTALNSQWARLGAYAFLPHLWWACPPACNVVVPDEILNWQVADPGIDNITRLMAKVAPGRSGASRVLVDKFSAPNTYDLNLGAQDPNDEPRDPEQLYRPEYISGPRPDVYYFERLHRLVRDEDWEAYLSSFISTEFWNRRLGARVATLSMRNSIRPVVGAPLLVIRGTGSLQVSAPDPAQLHWLSRLRNLTAIRRLLSQARSRLGSNVSVARRIRSILQNMHLVRSVLQQLPSTFSDPDLRDLTTLGVASWVQACAPQGSRNGAYDIQQLAALLNRSFEGGNVAAAAVSRAGSRLGGGGELAAPRFSGTQEEIRRLVSTDQDDAIKALTAMFLEPNQWTLSKLARWYQEVQDNTVDPSACRSALDSDLERIDAAIEECRRELREVGADQTEEGSYLGYVYSVSESASPQGTTLTISLSHVRKVGEDLDWDGLNSDDPEAVVAFGEDGYVDEQYRADNIGEKVYKPVYGCGSIADLDLARTNQAQEDEDVAAVDGLPPIDGSDVRAEFEHPAVCGTDYSDTDTSEGITAADITTSAAARALIQAYRAQVAAGARSEDIMTWLETIRVRATASPADMYRNMPALFTSNGEQSEPLVSSRDDDTAYDGDRRLDGFFANSFLAGDLDYNRVGVVSVQSTGATEQVTLSDDEKDLLQDRVRRIQAYLGSVSDKTFSRTG